MDIALLVGIGLAALVAATLGSMLGLGGGVFLVPILTLFFDIDPHIAVGASAVCVVSNSIVGSSTHIRSGFTNLHLAMVLLVTTTAGAMMGALIALRVNAGVISVVLGLVLLYSAGTMLRQRRVSPPPVPPGTPDPWNLRTTFVDPATKTAFTYLPQRIRTGLVISGGAGVISGLTGIGGGAIQVPLMNLLMQIPVKAAAGTSAFMVGLTAVATSAVFFAHDEIDPSVVVPALVGIYFGARVGSQVTRRLPTQRLILVFVGVLAYLGASMVLKPFGIGF